MRFRLLVLPLLLLAAAPAGASAAWRASAVDADRDGRIDAVQMSGVPRALQRCPRWRVSGSRVTRVQRQRGGRVTLSLKEGRINTALRPVVTCAAAHGRTRAKDGARPVPVSARPAHSGGIVVRFSEPLRRRRANRVILESTSGRRTGGRAGATPAGASSIVVRPREASESGAATVVVRPGAASDAAGHSSPAADLTIGAEPYPDLPAVTPASASQFVDSVGVNTHMSYYDTSYNDYRAIVARLQDLGVKYIREGACAGCYEQQRRLLALGAAGIKADLIVGPPGGPETIDQMVGMVSSKLAPMVASIEGPNEFDQSGQLDWALKLRRWQQALYARVKSDPTLSNVPVIGPSLVKDDSYAALGDISQYVDCGNAHPYPGGVIPTFALFKDASLARTSFADKPLCITESGYHNAVNTTDLHAPASEEAAAAYVPRLFLDHFRLGIPRTFLYELADEKPEPGLRDPEQHFGLLRSDLSEKPAFVALRSLLQLIKPDSQAPAVPLRYTATGPAKLHQLLFQQDARHQVLVLWRDVSVWDRLTRRDEDVAPERVDVTFGQPIDRAETYALDSATGEPTDTVHGPRSLGVDVTGQAVVVRLTLPG